MKNLYSLSIQPKNALINIIQFIVLRNIIITIIFILPNTLIYKKNIFFSSFLKYTNDYILLNLNKILKENYLS